jgi:hypothetical protein
MTRDTPAELRDLIRSDIPDLEKAGLEMTPELYLAEGQKPPTVTGTVLAMIGLGIIGVMCFVCFTFPRIVFVPRPADPMIVLPPDDDQGAGVRATGQFLELKSVEPHVEIGRRTRKFSNAVANLVPLEDRSLLIYVHHIARTRLYGVLTISESKSHWGTFVTGDRVIDIEPGKLYGWRDRWAVRFRYRGRDDKPETLLVSFDHAVGQAGLVELLRKLGFTVGTGMAV